LKPTLEHERYLIRYLLGSLPEQEQELLEQHYLVDEHLFDELIIIETELADRYVQGTLSASDRALLEEHWLSDPRRAQRLAFAEDLFRYVEREMFCTI